ncbi:MAG: hypothetical protein IIA44_07935 [Acidobacteria bacterium]|nr:hypothetical protein [Acidobacteriota bacterium]
MTATRFLDTIATMIHRVARVLLVVALGSTAGSAPFAHVPMHRRSPQQRVLVRRGAHRDAEPALVHLDGHAPGTNTLVGDRHRHLSVGQLDDAVARPSGRVGATSALVEVWEARVVPDLPGRAVPVAANARPNRPPRGVLAARAPPV